MILITVIIISIISPGYERQVHLPLTLPGAVVRVLAPGRHVALELRVVQILAELLLVARQADRVDVELGIKCAILHPLELASGQAVWLSGGAQGQGSRFKIHDTGHLGGLRVRLGVAYVQLDHGDVVGERAIQISLGMNPNTGYVKLKSISILVDD